MIAVLSGLGLVSLFGFLLLTVIWGQTLLSLGERLVLGYGLGLGLFTYLMFIAMALGLHLSAAWILSGLIFLTITTGFLAWHRWGSLIPFLSSSLTLSSRSIRKHLWQPASVTTLVIVGYFWLAALITALYWPVWSWDALAMFDFRGRAIFAEQSIGFLEHSSFWGAFPLLTSLAHAFVYFLGGTNPKIIYPLYYLALLLIFYHNAQKISSKLAVGVFTLLLSTTPLLWQHATIAYTNLAFTFYFTGGVIYAYHWLLTSRKAYLLIGGLLLGLSAWTRYGVEPLLLAVLLPVALYGLLRRQFYAPFLLILTFLSLDLPWLLYQRYILEASSTGLFGVQLSLWDIHRLWLTSAYLGKFLMKIDTQGTVWLIFLLLLFLNIKNLGEPSLFLAGVVLLGLGAWVASIYSTALEVDYLANASGERLLLSFIPIAAFYGAINPITIRLCAMFGDSPIQPSLFKNKPLKKSLPGV